MPLVEESYNPDRTRLSLEFAKKQAIKTNDIKQTIKNERQRLKNIERKLESFSLKWSFKSKRYRSNNRPKS